MVELLAGVGCAATLVIVETDGDRRADVAIDRIGGQGVFVKEVQAAVARGDADAAVHSAKDLPAESYDRTGLELVAVPERADPRDLLVGASLSSLPVGALVATGSARRRAQLANLRPDLTFTGLRGNLATRLSTLGSRGIVAVVVAKAAVDRLDWRPDDGVELDVLVPGVMLPQVGQGALAVECRPDDDVTRSQLAAIDDPAAHPPVLAERAFLAELGGGCTLPVGAFAEWATGPPGADPLGIRVTGMIASGDGRVVLRDSRVGTDPDAVGRAAARALLDDAGGSDLGEWTARAPEVVA